MTERDALQVVFKLLLVLKHSHAACVEAMDIQQKSLSVQKEALDRLEKLAEFRLSAVEDLELMQ